MFESLFGTKKPQPNPNEKFDDFVTRLEQKYQIAVEKITANANQNLEKVNASHDIEITELNSDHAIKVKELEFTIKHNESELIKKAQTDLVVEQKKNAVLEQKVEMLDKIVDLNADVIDVKDLVTQLINKLPEIKISNLSVAAGGKPKE